MHWIKRYFRMLINVMLRNLVGNEKQTFCIHAKLWLCEKKRPSRCYIFTHQRQSSRLVSLNVAKRKKLNFDTNSLRLNSEMNHRYNWVTRYLTLHRLAEKRHTVFLDNYYHDVIWSRALAPWDRLLVLWEPEGNSM